MSPRMLQLIAGFDAHRVKREARERRAVERAKKAAAAMRPNICRWCVGGFLRLTSLVDRRRRAVLDDICEACGGSGKEIPGGPDLIPVAPLRVTNGSDEGQRT